MVMWCFDLLLATLEVRVVAQQEVDSSQDNRAHKELLKVNYTSLSCLARFLLLAIAWAAFQPMANCPAAPREASTMLTSERVRD